MQSRFERRCHLFGGIARYFALSPPQTRTRLSCRRAVTTTTGWRAAGTRGVACGWRVVLSFTTATYRGSWISRNQWRRLPPALPVVNCVALPDGIISHASPPHRTRALPLPCPAAGREGYAIIVMERRHYHVIVHLCVFRRRVLI